MQALIWGQIFSYTEFYQAGESFCDKSSPFLCSWSWSFSFEWPPLTCPITSSKNNLLPFQKFKTEQPLWPPAHIAPRHLHAPYNPWNGQQRVAIPTCTESCLSRHTQEQGLGRQERQERHHRAENLLWCSPEHAVTKKEKKREKYVKHKVISKLWGFPS